ncbi:hypothetical protein P170DRAFT_478135 [Aspergillus steynii IBT 23096]|uniref:Uncharacterized protein n=1 Tax=Aspergillus steynii IBT 23096 TaxID=1392250 RepID=A0A2I2G331_9EURO|nr:uncharacterized protein P170DRAFT_478135 [Aspergillus steynii IBT 23096]PLB47281.1 hypothetical protein P170DRAFT_478135 [Aspergillus steynii IBT 23096]
MTFSRWGGKWAEGLAALGTARDRAARPHAASGEIFHGTCHRLRMAALPAESFSMPSTLNWWTTCGQCQMLMLRVPLTSCRLPIRRYSTLGSRGMEWGLLL